MFYLLIWLWAHWSSILLCHGAWQSQFRLCCGIFHFYLPACLSWQCMSESWVRRINTHESADKHNLRMKRPSRPQQVYLSDCVEWHHNATNYAETEQQPKQKEKIRNFGMLCQISSGWHHQMPQPTLLILTNLSNCRSLFC